MNIRRVPFLVMLVVVLEQDARMIMLAGE